MSTSFGDKRGGFGRSVVATSVLLAVTTSVLLGPATLQAQPKGGVGAGSASAPTKAVTDEKKKEAAERFKRGVKLQEEGSLDAAVIEFERAYELSPGTYQVLYNIAVVYRDKNDRASALRAFERFLVEGKDGIDAKRRKDVETELVRLRESVATVLVKTNVAGAEVTIDDVPMGKTPLAQPILLNVGRHRVEATKDGYRSENRVITLAGRDASTVDLTLREIKTDVPPPATTVAPPATTPPPATTVAPPPTTKTPENTGYTGLGYGLGIVGIVGLGVGIGFGVSASGKWDDAKKNCTLDTTPKTCPPASQKEVDKARNFATISTLGFGLGGALVVAGIVLVATGGTSEAKSASTRTWGVSPVIGQGRGGLHLDGSF